VVNGSSDPKLDGRLIVIEAVSRMLAQCGCPGAPLPPTELYNEGWMLRLVLDCLARHPNSTHPLALDDGARWASEVLLPSRFLPSRRGDPLGEGFTHADGVVGHFDVRPGRGDILLRSDARQLLVIEAKLGSPLSSGTRRAPEFDQAARNAACIAHFAAHIERTTFLVIAPRPQIASGVFGNLVSPESIAVKVKARCEGYGGEHDRWFADTFEPALRRMQLGLLSWEDVLDQLPDRSEAEALRAFYSRCLEFNPLRARDAASP
jgi:hypothetical protein